MEIEPLKRIVEAALLAAPAPLSLPQLFALFGEDEQPRHEDVARALDELARDCEGRGIELKEVASGFRYQVRADVNPWVARLWAERQTRYSRAQLETLALIAYRQPITRGEIENIRGVTVSSNIIKTLEEREWIRTVGHRDVPGKPELLGTTRAFLDYFNLKSLDELPPLAEIRDLSEFEPQLSLAPVAVDEAAAESTVSAESAQPPDPAVDGDVATPTINAAPAPVSSESSP
jgi:segregation and condensation protein B